ncbi:MAG: hypothetical protein CME35_00975 [Gramella sp.]|nr:hypothetical protein [Christiangramia sp.]|tara:strand:- start:526 stop:744 length:219 start_codon:yes stop_codon:yes gene_type:complete
MKFMIMRKQTLDMKESRITYNDLWEDLKEEEALADEKAGYPPKCNPGYEASEDGKKCVPVKKDKATHKKKKW